MRRYLFLFTMLSMIFACGATGAAQVARITGMLESPEAALDGSLETTAVLSRAVGKDYFEFIIYLDEELYPDSVKMYVSSAPEDVALEASVDIVNWTPLSVVIMTTEEQGMHRVVLDVGDRVQAQYLRLRIKAGEASQISLVDVSVAFAELQPNSIIDPVVKNISDYSVAVEFRTDLPAQTHIGYGANGPVMTNVYIDRFKTTEHRAVLEDLLAGTEYYYQIRLTDTDETSEVRTFVTTGIPLPVILRTNVIPDPGPDTADVGLGANKPVVWEVECGEYSDAAAGDKPEIAGAAQVKKSDSALKNFRAHFDGLTPKTKYFYRAKATDAEGNTVESEPGEFTTSPLNMALGAVVTGTFVHELQDKYIEQTELPMSRITDGDENYRTGFSKSVKPAYEDQWVEVDLGKDMETDRVVIVWSDLAVPETYAVSVRAGEGENFELLKIDNGEYPEDVKVRNRRSVPGGDPLMEVSLEVDRSIRYIKILIPKGTRMKSRFGWKYAILAEVMAIAP